MAKASTYQTKYGIDFPAEFSDTFIDMTVAKKWRLYEDHGIKVDADPGECAEKAMNSLFGDRVKMSAWTRDMIHDLAREPQYAMVGCGASGKSHAMAAFGLMYWLVDPFDTAVIVGSATLTDLRTRAWSPMLELFTHLKGNKKGVPIPGRIVGGQYAIRNEKEADLPESQAARASIQGRALDEGRIQGTHVPWVMLIVDELALVRDIEALKEAITNIRIGTLGFKSVFAANPDPWESPTSCFFMPKPDEKVTVDTGSWYSRMGYFVRHFDGEKSPVVLNPELKSEFPFLMSREDIDATLLLCNGDTSTPVYWKMIRGFPITSGVGAPTLLDPLEATRNHVLERMPPSMTGYVRRIGMCAGVDPAWSARGDSAMYCRVNVIEQDGRVYLDFSGGLSRLHISAESQDPVTLQLRNGVLHRMRGDGGPPITHIYVDSSGNQGLADDLDLYVGPGCGHINASERASKRPIRAGDPNPAHRRVRDRGIEAWLTLAEFCRAGQVRGLPQAALDGLTRRQYATRPGTQDPVTPSRMEPKDEYIKRYKGSPDETDTCALAALAVKEVLGVMPYGGVPPAHPDAIVPEAYLGHRPSVAAGSGCLLADDYTSADEDFDVGVYDPAL